MSESLDSTMSASATNVGLNTIDLRTLDSEEVVLITTQLGIVYRTRVNTMVAPDNDDKVNILVAMLPQHAEHRQHAQAIITVGEPWEIHDGHIASDITSISLVQMAA